MAEEATNAQARSTNLNNFAMNLSSIGETALNRRLVAAVHGYTFDDLGNIIRTPGYSPDYAVPQATTEPTNPGTVDLTKLFGWTKKYDLSLGASPGTVVSPPLQGLALLKRPK